MAPLCDHLFAVPSTSTPAIQQVHLCLYHCFCAGVEAAIADGTARRDLAAAAPPPSSTATAC